MQMAFNENTTGTIKEELSELLKAIMTGVHEDDTTSSWDEHREAVDKAEEACDDSQVTEINVDLSSTTLVDKVGMVCHGIFDRVLTGELVIESGQELLAMTEAAAIRERLRILKSA